MGRRFPVGKPTPFAAYDVHERVSYRTKAATQITSELLGPESRNRLQNPVVCPTVVLVEQLNVILSHGERVPAICLANPIPDQHWVKSIQVFLASWTIRPSDVIPLADLSEKRADFLCTDYKTGAQSSVVCTLGRAWNYSPPLEQQTIGQLMLIS